SHLKRDPATRHIPVQILTVEEERQHGLEWGAYSYLLKPMTTDELESAFERLFHFAEPRVKQLLVVDDSDVEYRSIVELLGSDDVEITTVATGTEALTALSERPFDCMVLDLRLPDLSGFEDLEHIQQRSELQDLPIVVFTGKELTSEEEIQLKKMAKSII